MASRPQPRTTTAVLPRRLAAGSLASLRTTLDQAPVGLMQIDFDGRVTWINRRVSEITGFTKAELRHQHDHELVHAADARRHQSLMRKVMQGELPQFTADERLRRREGNYVWVTTTATLARTDSGRPLHVVAAVTDFHPRQAPRSEPAGLSGRGSNSAADDAGIVRYGPLVLDFERLKVQIEGREVMLTAMELTVLWYLIQNRGRVLSRERLMTEVWGYQQHARSRTVDVHICRLRKKSRFLAEAIITVESGYRLVDPPPSRQRFA